MMNNIGWYLALAAFSCLLALGAAGQDDEIVSHYKELNVFSSLQIKAHSSNNAFLPPYPVGIELVLTCQTLGRETYWYERDQHGKPQLLNTGDRSVARIGLHASEYNIPKLSITDQNRTLMCGRDGSDRIEDVKINVVRSPNITVKAVKGEISCTASGFNKNLKLCWFEGNANKSINCKVSKVSDRTGTVTTKMPFELNLEEGMVAFHCQPKLRKEKILGTQLNKEALDQHEKMFDAVRKDVTAISEATDSSFCDTVQKDLSDSSVFYIAVEEGCYKVNITESRNNKAAPLSTTTTTTTTTAAAAATSTITNEETETAKLKNVATSVSTDKAAAIIFAMILVFVY